MSLLALLLGALPSGTPALPIHDTEGQDTELLTLYVADAATCFADPKDAGLLEALRLIDDRVTELSGELPGFPALPPEVCRLCAHLLTGEKALRIGTSSDPNIMFPVYGQLELMEGDPEKAARIAKTVTELASSVGIGVGPARESDGLSALQLPAPIQLNFGARGENVVLNIGKTLNAPVDLTRTGLPDGVSPSFYLHLDVGAITDLALGFAAMGAPEEAKQIERFVDLLGLDELVLDVATGQDAERSYTTLRMPGYGGAMREMGMMPARFLEARDLAMVPSDAVWAAVGTMQVEGTFDFVLAIFEDELAKQGMGDPVGMLAAMTGFDVRADFLQHLGSVYGMYTSDTTGGGGLLSAVGFVELTDAEGMLETLERLQDIANDLGTSEAEGYVQVRSWTRDDTECFTLTFPGLPIPFEPTLAITPHYLFFGITPQATLAAVGQASSDGRGLLDNPRFRENLASDPVGAYSVEFLDSPRLLRSGYGLTSLLCSALVNGTRSRTDGTRDAGVILPPYHELMKDAKASVGVTRVVGDDFVSEYRGDRSALVNLTSVLGAFGSSPAALLLPAALIGGVAFARAEAAETEAIMFEELIEEQHDEHGEHDDHDDR